MNNPLFGSEAVTVDLIALRNWHFQASVDAERSPYMRRWHRGQVRAINAKLPKLGPGNLTIVKVALIELLATRSRKVLHRAIATGSPFNWREKCLEAMRELELEESSVENAEAVKSPPDNHSA